MTQFMMQGFKVLLVDLEVRVRLDVVDDLAAPLGDLRPGGAALVEEEQRLEEERG